MLQFTVKIFNGVGLPRDTEQVKEKYKDKIRDFIPLSQDKSD
jgi:hypothetical protein